MQTLEQLWEEYEAKVLVGTGIDKDLAKKHFMAGVFSAVCEYSREDARQFLQSELLRYLRQWSVDAITPHGSIPKRN